MGWKETNNLKFKNKQAKKRRNPLKPKVKKPKQRTLKVKSDKLWSLIVRSRAKCQWCGVRNTRMEAAHIISRTYSKTRHNLYNGLCLCSACHRRGHQFPTLFTMLVIKLIGREKLDELHAIAQETGYQVDYAPVYEDLCQTWEKIEKEQEWN